MEFWRLTQTAGGLVGRCVTGGPGRIFGGHTLAHSLMAAALTSGTDRPPSSLHALFLAPGDPAVDVRYTGTTLKHGRSLTQMRVEAKQGETRIVEMLATFHAPEPGRAYDHGSGPPSSPDGFTSEDPALQPAARTPFDVRQGRSDERGFETWIRLRDDFGDREPFMHACMLAYAVDFVLSRSGRMQLPDPDRYFGASLDHAMWFHRPFRIDEWLLVRCNSDIYTDSRALCRASVHTESGELVSTAQQEVLFRDTTGAR